MDEEPGHKAMLYFLEVLMNSNGRLTISQLAGRFGSKNFTAEMRQAAGGNEAGLKKFLLKYPSLFTVTGNIISLFDGSVSSKRDVSPESTTSSLPDVSMEMESVRYFQNRLATKDEKWILIKSLAGHLSQASADIRNCVGPQLEFRKWLLRHPHIFEVSGEYVALRDGVSTPTLTRKSDFELIQNGLGSNPLQSPTTEVRNTRPLPPKTPPATRRVPPKTPPANRKFREMYKPPPPPVTNQGAALNLAPPPQPAAARRAPITMTANEYKAVMFLKGIVEKKGGLKLHSITGHFSQAVESVRNTIGWTKMELEEFLRKNSNVFVVSEDETVTVRKNARLNVIITGSRPQMQTTRTLTGRKGRVFHVAKLWGIIDLGKHEHVFFDKSIMDRPIDDLQREFVVGEILNFNAVLATKTSRAKWRAIQVWKEHEAWPTDIIASDSHRNHNISSTTSIEEEINELLRRNMDDATHHLNGLSSPTNDPYSDAAPSGAGVVAVWNQEHDDGDEGDTLSMVSESYHMCTNTMNENIPEECTSSEDGNQDSTPSLPTSPKRLVRTESLKIKRTAEVSCQTISTGEIIATQLYHDK